MFEKVMFKFLAYIFGLRKYSQPTGRKLHIMNFIGILGISTSVSVYVGNMACVTNEIFKCAYELLG